MTLKGGDGVVVNMTLYGKGNWWSDAICTAEFYELPATKDCIESPNSFLYCKNILTCVSDDNL